jgi:hypothetical protein
VAANAIVSNALAAAQRGANPAAITEQGPNVISQNAIVGNAGLPIDRNGDGPTANVPGAAGNFPVLALTPGGNAISGTINGPANQIAQIEIYSADDNGGAGSLRRAGSVRAAGSPPAVIDLTDSLGRVSVATDAAGNGQFRFPLGGRLVGRWITATTYCVGGGRSPCKD